MSLFDTINEHIKDAMKAREKERLDALRYMKAMLIENKTSKAPKDEQEVVIGHHKKLSDSLSTYPADSEMAEKIKVEISHVANYMPKPLTEEEVKGLIKGIIAANAGANMGVVMKELSPQIKGKFDGKRATDLIKEMLS